MDTTEHIIHNSDISFLLKSHQDFSAFYNFLQNYFYQDTQHLQKSPIFSDNTSIEKKIIVNIPFLLNSQIPILFDDFLCYPIFYRHRQIIFDSKSQKHTTHYVLFLEKYLHKYEQLNDHFLILLDYFQKEKLDSILNSHYFSLEFQKKISLNLIEICKFVKNPPFDLDIFILDKSEQYYNYLVENSSLNVTNITNQLHLSTFTINKNQ